MIIKQEVNCIQISNLSGKVFIKNHDKNEIEVKTKDEKNINVDILNNRLIITGEKNNPNNIVNSFNGVNISGGNIIVSGNASINGINFNSFEEIYLEILIPKNKVKEMKFSGQVESTIDIKQDEMKLKCSGQTITNLNGVKIIGFEVSGQSEFFAEDINEAQGKSSGQSDIRLHGKKDSDFNVKMSGQSSGVFKAEQFSNFNIQLSGMSDAVVYGNIDKKIVEKSGMSEINFF